MSDLIYIMAMTGGFCLLLGVVYPIFMICLYPIYRRFGGRDSFKEYFKSI